MRLLLLIALATAGAFAQAFVVSVKTAKPGKPGMSARYSPGGRIVLENVTVRYLIDTAWSLHEHQLSGAPAWIDSAHFDIEAKPETEASGEVRMRMIQAILLDRFGLVFHRETKEMPIYALVIAKNGPKLIPGVMDETAGGSSSGNGMVQGKGLTTQAMADLLSVSLERTVVDKTGLKGVFNFKLQWKPDADAESPSIFTAIQEQLGLKLEPQKGPVELFVIDHVAPPSDN